MKIVKGLKTFISCNDSAIEIANQNSCGDFERILRANKNKKIYIECAGTYDESAIFDVKKADNMCLNRYHYSVGIFGDFAASIYCMANILSAQGHLQINKSEIE